MGWAAQLWGLQFGSERLEALSNPSYHTDPLPALLVQMVLGPWELSRGLVLGGDLGAVSQQAHSKRADADYHP
jgi:hypothetical protein